MENESHLLAWYTEGLELEAMQATFDQQMTAISQS